VQRFTGGPRFLDDLPHEILADGDELSSAAQMGNRADGGDRPVR
jgi:hypothetical protein